MRVCIEKTTGKVIESQSGGEVDRRDIGPNEESYEYQEYLMECTELEAMRLDTLKQNALNAGYQEDEIEVFWEEDANFEIRMTAQRESELTYADRRRAEYPLYADYLDGVVKGDQLQIDKYIADCLAVKAKYPKN